MNGIYMHIPFCLKKCLYCDFVSHADHDSDIRAQYINAAEKEMRTKRGTCADSVFIGGGTPTVLEPALLEKLISAVNENFELSRDCEFTIEANPRTIDAEKLKILRSGGINRISIGVQSFFDNELAAIGRIHSASDAEQAVILAQECGFENINVDIMSSIPHQTPETLARSLRRAAELGAAHISCYSLIVEKGTPIYDMYEKGIYVYPDDDADRDMYYTANRTLRKLGYSRYEISNYAVAGRECRHNLKYWRFEPYIGIGAAAHSFDGASRKYNTHNIKEYISGNFEAETNRLSRTDMIEEYMITGLRTVYGINESDFLARFGDDLRNIYGSILDKFIKSGHMAYNKGIYTLTDKGIDVSNSILCEFIL